MKEFNLTEYLKKSKSKENAIKNKRNDDYLATVKIEWEE